MHHHLFFALNNNKQFTRHIQILNFMDCALGPLKVSDIAQHVGCSTPTLRQDILDLNDILNNSAHIASPDKEGYSLIRSDEIPLDHIIMKMAQESDVFRIIDGIFRSEIHSFDDLLSTLFLSPTKLRKSFNHINRILASYNISLTTRPVTFVGEESDIRYFFFAFYSDFNDYFTVDEAYYHNEPLYQTLHMKTIQRILPHLQLSTFRTTLWNIILLQRIKHKQFVKLELPFKKSIQSLDIFQSFKEAFGTVYTTEFMVLEPPIDDIIWAFTTLLHCVSYSAPSPSLFNHYIKDFTFMNPCPSERLVLIESLLLRQFHEDALNEASFDALRSFLINLSVLTEISPQFQRVSQSFLHFALETFEHLVTLWIKHLESAEAQALFPIYFKEDLAASLASLHFSYMSHQNDSDFGVLFSFHGEPGYDDFLMFQSQFMIPQHVTSSYLFDKPITSSILSLIPIDLIVTNYDIPNRSDLSQMVIQMSYIPSMSEWTGLRNIILNLCTSKQMKLSSNLE